MIGGVIAVVDGGIGELLECGGEFCLIGVVHVGGLLKGMGETGGEILE